MSDQRNGDTPMEWEPSTSTSGNREDVLLGEIASKGQVREAGSMVPEQSGGIEPEVIVVSGEGGTSILRASPKQKRSITHPEVTRYSATRVEQMRSDSESLPEKALYITGMGVVFVSLAISIFNPPFTVNLAVAIAGCGVGYHFFK